MNYALEVLGNGFFNTTKIFPRQLENVNGIEELFHNILFLNGNTFFFNILFFFFTFTGDIIR